MPVPASETLLKALFANLGRYLANLSRAGRDRKAASRKALQGVILATRKTRVYLRQLESVGRHEQAPDSRSRSRGKSPAGSDDGRRYDKEEELAALWTGLSFELQQLGVDALAKRCDITGAFWSDPERFSRAFLDKARVRLRDIESDARTLLAQTR